MTQVREVFSTILQFREIIVSNHLAIRYETHCPIKIMIRTISTTTPCPSRRGWIKCGMLPAGYTQHPVQLTLSQFMRFASFSKSIALHSVNVCRLLYKPCSLIQIWIVVSLGYVSRFPSSIVRKRIGKFSRRDSSRLSIKHKYT